jgi:hypothetical protein
MVGLTKGVELEEPAGITKGFDPPPWKGRRGADLLLLLLHR